MSRGTWSPSDLEPCTKARWTPGGLRREDENFQRVVPVTLQGDLSQFQEQGPQEK